MSNVNYVDKFLEKLIFLKNYLFFTNNKKTSNNNVFLTFKQNENRFDLLIFIKVF